MKNNKEAQNLSYEAFMQWHREATERLLDGESLAKPSPKFYESWRRRRLDEAVRDAVNDRNYTEAAILVDLREAWRAEQKKDNHRTFHEVEQAIRNVYAGNNPYLAGPVSVTKPQDA